MLVQYLKLLNSLQKKQSLVAFFLVIIYIIIGDDMINVLIYLSDGLIILGFIGYFLLILFYKNKLTDTDGFNITKDILNDFDSINIIENNSYFTIYNIKRKVIKIASKCYYDKSISSLSIPLMEAGISIVDNKKNKFISFFSIIISNLKYLYILPICAIFFNSIFTSSIDAKIGFYVLILFSVISYIFISIKTDSALVISNKLSRIKLVNKDERMKINNFLDKIILFDKFIFIGELIMIIRFLAVMLSI